MRSKGLTDGTQDPLRHQRPAALRHAALQRWRSGAHFETATHGALGPLHYARWLATNHPEAVDRFYPVLDMALEVNAEGGGETGAPQVHDNAVPREWYHTDWVADRTIAWLESLTAADDWFCWMSFPIHTIPGIPRSRS